jgi:hypothetical protein
MRKTNIRINGYYLARQGNQYFKTKINNHQTWIEEENIVDFVEDNITDTYLKLSNDNNIRFGVNFLTTEHVGG